MEKQGVYSHEIKYILSYIYDGEEWIPYLEEYEIYEEEGKEK